MPFTNPNLFRDWFRCFGHGTQWLAVVGALGLLWISGTTVKAQTASAGVLRIGYVADRPEDGDSGRADPLGNIARSLGTAFAQPVDPEYPLPSDNIIGAESWEELSRTIQLGNAEGGAELFALHSYELIDSKLSKGLNLKPLLLATRHGHWQTRFRLLASASSQIQQIRDLENKKVLIHRDGCGKLVEYWLDSAIARGTGQPRKGFARYQTVPQCREAVLQVFFGEADACVVSVDAFEAVVAQNPAQIRQKLNLVLAESKDLPAQVVACRQDLPVDVQRRVVEMARLTWDFGDETGAFIPSEEVAFDNLRALLDERLHPPGAAVPELLAPAAKLQTAAPAKPVKRP